MKWQDVKDFFDDLVKSPLRTMFLLGLLLVCAYLIALATAAGKADGQNGLSKWWPFGSATPDCNSLYESDLEKWLKLCDD